MNSSATSLQFFKRQSTYMDRVFSAAREFIRRQFGESSPKGYHVFGGHWQPDEREKRDCCRRALPSERVPYAALIHCSGILHVACLFDVDPVHLFRIAEVTYPYPYSAVWLNSAREVKKMRI